ncbi:hypothetical protein PR048_029375 [Dryococelus australis]|uniref:DUF4371 domain-containing protein n=1 Tax=Dryococelus australis TaxID=614101 RepID=A0ABQ9GD86_9NEOP|nr:hypothetical protein PR048_029375 [Dryococelus australis]
MKRSNSSYFISTKKEILTEATNTPKPSANSDVTDDMTTTGTSDTEPIEEPELSFENYVSGLLEDPGSSSDSFVTEKISTPNHSRKKDTENRERLHGIVETIRLRGLQNIPLRSHTDCGHISLSIPVDIDGNFRSFLRYRANGGGQALQDHIKNSSPNAMYTSPQIQNEIDCFGQLIQKKTVERVKKSLFYTVLADEITDISQDFLSFDPVYDVTGEALAEVIERSLAACGLDLAHIRGQGYDGASSMRGQFRSVQALLRKKYPKVIYTHCVILSLADLLKVQRRKRKANKVLEEKIKQLEPSCSDSSIKALCETRLCEHHESVLFLKQMLEPIESVLKYLSELPGDHSKKASLILNSICTA